MKSKVPYYLLVFSLLFIIQLNPVKAVTDAEIEALEKQIEQQETEEKKQVEAEKIKNIEAEAKRKEEIKRKVEADAKRKSEKEEKRKAEDEVEKKAEEARLAEIERQRQDDEAKKKAEEEAQKREEAKREQFSQHMKNADSTMNNKDYTESLKLYTQALEIFPSNTEALTGKTSAQKFYNICSALVGEWDYAFVDNTMIATADGKVRFIALIPNHGRWECTDPLQRIFTLYWEVGGWVDTLTMSADGNTLDGINNVGFGFQGFRKGTKKMDPSREVPL
jgi:tetratricopeptide (TPR) repeat protein